MPEEPNMAIADLCEGCVRFVEQAVGLKLDYTPETLPLLDHFVRERARSHGGETTAEEIDLLAATLGAYFGEVVRRRLGHARWAAEGTDAASYRLELEPFFLSVSPWVIAADVIARGQGLKPPSAFEVLDDARPAVEEALARQGRVALDDYYSFSVRYEVLELIASVLAGLEEKRGEPRSFGPDVYRAALGERSAKAKKDAS